MLPVRQIALTLVALVAGPIITPSVAFADDAPDLAVVLDRQLSRRLRGRPSPAGAKKLIYGSAKPYAKARELLSRGEAAGALKALKAARNDLLVDREALVRGEALSALGDHAGAVVAFATALEHAQILGVGLDAARGLRKTLRALDRRKEELTVLEALLDVRNIDHRPDLLLARIQAYRALGRHQDAVEAAWRLIHAYPTSAVVREANGVLSALKKKGFEPPKSDERTEQHRIRNLIRARAHDEAQAAIAGFEARYPELQSDATMLRLDLLNRTRKRDEERALLMKLYRAGLGRSEGPKVLYRLARSAMRQDDNPKAIKYFDELRRRFGRTSWARDGEYLAAWLPYSDGDYLETHKRMLAFSERHPRASKRTDALWYAGWSAYTAGRLDLAEKPWRTLLTAHPDSTLVPHVWYWMGRIAHRQKHSDEARNRYRSVLSLAPLSYYGFWATARLSELGEETVIKPPPPSPPESSLKEVVARLGPDRPRLIDRAVALHAAGLAADASAELGAGRSALLAIRDPEGRTVVADMLHRLGAHHLAFRLASLLTEEGTDLVSGEPLVWRAWRQAYPNAFEAEVRAAHSAHGVDTNLLWAVMRTESAFRPWIQSHAGARGLMQIMPRTARAIGRRAKDGREHAARYRDPDSNVWLGAWYLKQLSERYDGQLAAAVAAYNAGPSAADRWVTEHGGAPLDEFIERIPYKETRRYTRRVIETYFVYRRMKGLPLPDMPRYVAKTPPSGGVGF